MLDSSASVLLDKLNVELKQEGPSFTLEFRQKVHALEFSTYEWSNELICIAFTNKLTVGTLKFQEEHEGEQMDLVEFRSIQEFPCSVRVQAISWSPESSLKDVPKCLNFACAMANHKIEVYSSSVNSAYTMKVVSGHTSYINDLSYDPSGEFLASVSDDLTCQIWSPKKEYQLRCKFYLRFPGMGVAWHRSDPGKLVVGEKGGTVRMYNIWNETAIMSMRTDLGALMSIDWAPSNHESIAALVGSFLVVWRTSTPNSPFLVRDLHHGGSGWKVRFNRLSEKKLACLGSPDNSVKFLTLGKLPTTLANLKLASGLSWHHHLPYFAVGEDKSVHLWRIK